MSEVQHDPVIRQRKGITNFWCQRCGLVWRPEDQPPLHCSTGAEARAVLAQFDGEENMEIEQNADLEAPRMCVAYIGDGDFCQKPEGHDGYHNDMAPRCGAVNGEFVCDYPWHHKGDHYGSVRRSWPAHIDGHVDPEPQPTDGPDYHEEHAAWVRRNDGDE